MKIAEQLRGYYASLQKSGMIDPVVLSELEDLADQIQIAVDRNDWQMLIDAIEATAEILIEDRYSRMFDD